MPTKRRPRRRTARHRVTPEVIEAFRRMKAARDRSEKWWNAYWALHDALNLPPWILLDGSSDERIYPMKPVSMTTAELWREIKEAAKAV